MAGRNRVELVADAKIGAKGALHGCLKTSDGKTESNGDVVDNVHESITIFSGRKKSWPMAVQELGDRLPKRDVDVVGLEPVKEGTDVFGCLVCSGAGESIRQYADPDGRIREVTDAILDGLDGRNGVVIDFDLVLAVFFLKFFLDLPVRLLVEPGEPDEIDRRDFDAPFVEQLNNLGGPLVKKLLRKTREGDTPYHEPCPTGDPC